MAEISRQINTLHEALQLRDLGELPRQIDARRIFPVFDMTAFPGALGEYVTGQLDYSVAGGAVQLLPFVGPGAPVDLSEHSGVVVYLGHTPTLVDGGASWIRFQAFYPPTPASASDILATYGGFDFVGADGVPNVNWLSDFSGFFRQMHLVRGCQVTLLVDNTANAGPISGFMSYAAYRLPVGFLTNNVRR